ncbi:PepSY-associated TM helix domain-containing protein [Sphingobium sp. B12D2B]|uniref:PepSY-associated TM helix domain-containing protein n=1 Tax=Sphingobium sp. B12D2B TaxID=2940577 RepID=UPI00222504B6|nr:PepSY-associated TM helix domain-containing protein [Sphingobium sp. B12D2B]MCW2349155.1 putative iron-regulated membrane protein [Sphingobium sp. B12D2B]
MRLLLVALHRYTGLAIAGFLAIAGLTGSVLAFEKELDALLNPHLFQVEAGRPSLSLAHIADRVEQADQGAQVFTIVPPSKPGQSAVVYVGPRDGAPDLDHNQLFVDPADGSILDKRMNGAFRLDREHIIPFLYRLHYTLTIPGGWGVWLLGGVAVAWMMDCFVGFYLTLPRGEPFWKKWLPAWKIKRKAGAYRFNLDLHRAFGLWLWAVLFLIAFTSMSFNLNRELFRPVLTALLPTSPSIWDRPAPAHTPSLTVGWDAAAAAAKAEAARRSWEMPVRQLYRDRSLGFYMVRFGAPHEPGFGASDIFVSAVHGGIVSVEEAGAGQAGDVVAGLMLPIHSGQVAGLPGRILICLAGLVVTMLSVTGVYLWWKKRAARTWRRPVRNTSNALRRDELRANE